MRHRRGLAAMARRRGKGGSSPAGASNARGPVESARPGGRGDELPPEGAFDLAGASDGRLEIFLRPADGHTRSGRFVADLARPRGTGPQHPEAFRRRLAAAFRFSNVARSTRSRGWMGGLGPHGEPTETRGEHRRAQPQSRLRGRAHEALSHGNCLGSSAQGDRDGTRASPCHTHRCLRPRPPAPFCARAGEPPVASNRAANAQKPPCRRRTGASCGELARERRRTGHRGSRRAVALSRDGLDLGDGDPGSRHQCPAAECGPANRRRLPLSAAGRRPGRSLHEPTSRKAHRTPW